MALLKKPFQSLTAILLVTGSSLLGQARVHRVGIPPVEDKTGRLFQETYGDNLRRFLVAELIERGHQAIFLNTGPSLGASDRELIQEMAKGAKVDAIARVSVAAVMDEAAWKELEQNLPTQGARGSEEYSAVVRNNRMKPTAIQKLISRGHAVLVTEADLTPTSDPRTLRSFLVGTKLKRKFLKELAELNVPGSGGRAFRDSTPGRAAAKAAEQIGGLLDGWLANSKLDPTGFPPRLGGVCTVTFGIWFARQKRGSRNYTLAVNGKEQTYALRNGRVTLEVPGGLFQVHVTIQDAPYGLRTQEAYDANSFIDCPNRPKTATLEIGGAGEGELKWEDS